MNKNKGTVRVGLGVSAAVSLLAFMLPTSALALQISEVMYDPDGSDTGREWVEVWNDGPAAVDLAAIFLLESDVKHKIAPTTPDASAVLPSGERAIIADKPELFSQDYAGIAPVFDSAFSLSNAGERIALVSATGDEHSAAEWGTGSGATGGKSWQRAGASWLAAAATPGAANADREEASAPGPVSAPAAVSAHSGTGGLTTVRREPDLAVDAGRNRVVPVGVELSVEPEVEGTNRASFSWSWGDGQASRGRRGRHAYRYPGTYAVVLNVRGAGGAVATSRTTVLAVPIELAATATEGEDGVAKVVIRSASPHEINLGGFRIGGDRRDFVLPEDTILMPGGEIALDAASAGLALEPGDSVVVRRPDGRVVHAVGNV